MTRANAKGFHLFLGTGIFFCASWTLIELFADTSDSIFVSGSDLDATIALLFVLAGLTAIALRFALKLSLFQTFTLPGRDPGFALSAATFFAAVPPEISPPLTLRI